MKFKHNLGCKVESVVTKLKGIVTSRSENLYGCNRYFIQPKIGTDNKVPEGWWVDEDDVRVLGDGVKAPRKDTGGPMNRVC